MGEQRGPKDLVADAVLAENAGFEFAVTSDYLEVEDAGPVDLSKTPPRIGVAVSGEEPCAIAGRHADLLIATEPKADLIEMYKAEGRTGTDAVGQLPICWGPQEDASTPLTLERFGCSAGGWKLQAKLPNPVDLEAYAKLVRPEESPNRSLLGTFHKRWSKR